LKPFAQACENNKNPILAILREAFASARHVVEIGSGTGQHAVHFAASMPWLVWQPTDRAEHLPGIRLWVGEAALPNLLPPLELDVDQPRWPVTQADAVFSANTAHIMSWPQVERMFARVGKLLEAGGTFALYGPFNYNGRYTSASNADFDRFLRARDPASGLRDVEAIHELATSAGLVAVADHAMPANNRTLVWRKGG
jgi:cyclopropane fatty-acyl-phospholipid synthase-like methyltransferase